MIKLYRSIIFLTLFLFSYSLKGELSFLPVDLKTDHLENPIGIDNPNPRLTWRIEDNSQGAKQSAYRIIVGTDSLKVVNGEGEIWDSGKVDSDRQLVTYKGTNPTPFTKYFWKVIVWDGVQQTSTSGIQSFETGMMDISSWQGDWISDGKDIHYEAAPYFRKNLKLPKRSHLPVHTSPSPGCMSSISTAKGSGTSASIRCTPVLTEETSMSRTT